MTFVARRSCRALRRSARMMISAIATPVLRVYTKDKSAFYLIVPLNSCLSAARTHPRAHRAAIVGPRGEGPTSSGFTPDPGGAITSYAPTEEHLRRNARLGRSRSPDLLLGLQVQPWDRNQRRQMAG